MSWTRSDLKEDKISFFTWKATWEKILTLDELKKESMDICEYMSYGQKKNNPLTSCTMTKNKLWLVFSLFGISLVTYL